MIDARDILYILKEDSTFNDEFYHGLSTEDLRYLSRILDEASLKIYEEIGSKKGIAACYNNIGLIYKLLDNYPEALQNHFAALKIYEEMGNKSGITRSYNNIGIIYMYQGNYPDALKNHLASL